MEYENNPEIVQDHNIKILWDRDTVEKAIIRHKRTTVNHIPALKLRGAH